MRNLKVIGLMLISFAVVLLAFWPGYMSVDSIEQYRQALSGEYQNWHPPLLSFLWRLLLWIRRGPEVLFVLQVLLLWVLTWRATRNHWVCLATLFWFPILALEGTLWKDVWFVIAMLGLSQSQKWYYQFCFAFFAVSMRHNAWPALLPFLYLSSRGSFWKISLIDFAKVFVLFAGLLIGKGFVEGFLLNTKPQYPVQQILTHDLLALSLHQEKFLLPETFAPENPFSMDELRLLYKSGMIVPMYCCSGPEVRRYFPLLQNASQVSELQSRWIQEVPNDFSTYLKHRLKTFNELLGLGGRKTVCNAFHQGIDPNEYGFKTSENWIQKNIRRVLLHFENSLLFRAWVYLLMALGLLALGFLYKLNLTSTQNKILLSGVFYVFPYFFVSTTCDFRMSWWLVYGVTLVSWQLLWEKAPKMLTKLQSNLKG